MKLVTGQLRGATIRLEVAGEIYNATLSESDDGGQSPTQRHDLLVGIQEEGWISWQEEGR